MKNKNIIISAFLITPIITSIISTIHLVKFFNLGNTDWISWLLAIAFELGSVASFIALSVLGKIKKGIIIFIFLILFLLQLIGNVYFSFQYINLSIISDPTWMNTFIELVKPIYEVDTLSTYKFILSMLIGIPIPLVSLLFLKSLVDYLEPDKEINITDFEVNGEPKTEEGKDDSVHAAHATIH